MRTLNTQNYSADMHREEGSLWTLFVSARLALLLARLMFCNYGMATFAFSTYEHNLSTKEVLNVAFVV